MMVMDPVTPSIRNLMRMSREALSDNKLLIEKLKCNVEQKQIRCSTVRWILQVMTMSSSSVETRDCAVQMLDKFIAVLDLPLDGLPLRPADKSIISLAAAAAVILASKIHEIRPLRTSNFPHFKKEQLIDFERRFLLKISFQIVPQTTPSAFLRYLLNLWPVDMENENYFHLEAFHSTPNNCNNYGNNGNNSKNGSSGGNSRIMGVAKTPLIPYKDILVIADILLGLFWEDPECMCYAPSTIAISALLLTFSKLHLDCTEWLHCLPDECLPPKTIDSIPSHHSVFPNHDTGYLDIDNCLLCLQKIPMPAKYINLLNKGMSINVGIINRKNAPSSSSKKSNDSQNGDTTGENSKTSENSEINGNGNNGNSNGKGNNGNSNAGNDESENMDCDDSDGPSSVRTITPTSTAELTDERTAKKSNADVIK